MCVKTCPLDVCLCHFRGSLFLFWNPLLNFLPSDFFLIGKGFGDMPLENFWSDGCKTFRLQSLYISSLDLQVLRKQSNHELKSLLTDQKPLTPLDPATQIYKDNKYFSLSHIIIEENEILVGENESPGSVFYKSKTQNNTNNTVNFLIPYCLLSVGPFIFL